MRYLLDTNIITAPLAPRPDARLVAKLLEHRAVSATAAPVIHEIRFGVELLPVSKRRRTLETYLTDVVLTVYAVLSYDVAAGAWHAAERARLRKSGTEPPFVDGVIAAIAHTNDLILVTSNVRDFRRFRGLQVEDWRSRD